MKRGPRNTPVLLHHKIWDRKMDNKSLLFCKKAANASSFAALVDL